ncbi:MAG: tRNA (adenosine(37)-N6)-threonylcarbamoyltransferase complex ATPase subunit type 1 TsaE [bacterium]
MSEQLSHHAIAEGEQSRSFLLSSEEETIRFASDLALKLHPVSLVTLSGDLGAGKTTLARALIQAMGYEGRVKSPTYTLVEPYALPQREVFHFDLYRLADPEELEYLGIDDYFSGDALCLVEWASKGKGGLPPADMDISLVPERGGRRLTITALTATGSEVIASL